MNKICIAVMVLFLTGCKSTILSREGAKDVSNEAIIKLDTSLSKNVDKTLDYLKSLKLDELSASLKQNSLAANDTIKNVGDLSKSLNGLTDSLKQNSDKLGGILDETKRISSGINEKDVADLITNLKNVSSELNKLTQDVRKFTNQEGPEPKPVVWPIYLIWSIVVIVIGILVYKLWRKS